MGREHRSCKVLFPKGGGRRLLEKVTRRDDLSGLLVAVLDSETN